ncbi:hypothetical protein LJ739_02105 [Aestuariibacter halophilus]|uniref:DUF1570 domain-containing protein n=1 Tax=Fluctibacter halophilus TaxID=226011 RepID=A0ABS8G3G7_9ALTE|nr:DUF5700 domain-containing putative Zn-dependent protease [Aestuariibacter halophilus]MCC2615034.1 hypothetical protein [Aestuariibacter halophilus]
MLRFNIILVAALLLGVFQSTYANEQGIFDFSHVKRALQYFQQPTSANLQRVAQSPANQHLLAHAYRTGYYPSETTPLSLSEQLLAKTPTQEQVDGVNGLMVSMAANKHAQQHCVSEALAFAPQGSEIKGNVFMTWGYDIGVAMDNNASLNLAHPRFLEKSFEVWYYCIHEAHHTLVMQHFPMPVLADIRNTQQLRLLVQYLTFLEGSAVYAAYRARQQAGHLSDDPDYLALDDPDRLQAMIVAYFTVFERIKDLKQRPLTDADWALLDNLSDGDRLWYRVGAHMARTIDQQLGRQEYQRVLRQGDDAFFSAYEKVSNDSPH